MGLKMSKLISEANEGMFLENSNSIYLVNTVLMTKTEGSIQFRPNLTARNVAENSVLAKSCFRAIRSFTSSYSKKSSI